MTLWWVVLFLSGLVGSFFFAGVETGFVSWNPLKVSCRAKEGGFSANIAEYLLKNRDKVIATLLIGNNLCLVGVTLSFLHLLLILNNRVDFINLESLPSIETWILTPLLLVLCEMLPKSLFRIYSFRLTINAISMLFLFYCLFWPFTLIFTFLQRILISGKLKFSNYEIKNHTEMVLVAKEACRSGVLYQNADRFIENVINQDKKNINKYLCDSDNLENGFLFIDQNIKSIAKTVSKTKLNVYPVLDRGSGTVLGQVTIFDLATLKNGIGIKTIIKPIKEFSATFVSIDLLKLLKKNSQYFIKIKNHAGLISVDDLIDSLFV